MGADQGIEQGRKEVLQEVEKRRRNVAEKLIEQGVDPELVAKVTGIQVENLEVIG